MLPENTQLGKLRIFTVYNSSYLFLYAKIEDINTLVLLEGHKFIDKEDYYLDFNLKVYEVIVPESTVTEISLVEVQTYFSEYCEQKKKDQESFAEFLKQLHEE